MSLVAGCDWSQPSAEVVKPAVKSFRWRKYSRCSATACVEVSFRADHVLIRDSKETERLESHIALTHAYWPIFLAVVDAGASAENLPVRIEVSQNSVVLAQDSTELHFTKEEWHAFLDGVRAGEFEISRALELSAAE